MVHLATVDQPTEVKAPIEGLEHLKIHKPDEEEASATVYGSKFACEGLPTGEIPKGEM